VKIKAFRRDAEPFEGDAYYESFFNIDLVNGFVVLERERSRISKTPDPWID